MPNPIKKPASKKSAPKKPASKKPASKKSASKKSAPKKSAPKKSAPKKPALKTPAPKKSAPKKPALKTPAPKKPASKKSAPKKSAPKKSALKTPALKTPAFKRPAPKKSAPKKPAAAAEALDKLPPGESEEAFQKFREIARSATDLGPVERYRGGALIMLANVRRAVESLQPRDAEIAAHLPRLDRAAMWSAPELALALGFAVRAVSRESPEESMLPALLTRVYELRDLLLTNAEGLAKAGLFGRVEVERIRAGRGKPDAAQDCIDLAALYRRHAAAIRGKTPVTADKVRESAEVGAQALKLLRPARGKRAAAAPSEMTRDRDLLYTLLVTRYRDLRRAGLYLWLDEADNYVPALLSRERPGRPKKQPAPTPTGPASP